MTKALDFPIYQEILRDYSRYCGKESNASRYFSYPYPQRLSKLSEWLCTYTLREYGDIKRYLSLQNEILSLASEQVPETHKNIYRMMSWLDASIEGLSPKQAGLVICLMAYGKEYTRRLLEYLLPSFLAAGNLPSIGIPTTLFIVTDFASREMIDDSEMINRIKTLGINVDYAVIPNTVTMDAEPYWLLGAAASLGLQYAKKAGAAFHMSYPDMVYSCLYFAKLEELSKEHKAIMVPGMRADESLIKPALEPYKANGAYAVPCADLVALHLNALHRCAWGLLVNNRPRDWTFPDFHIMLWEGKDSLRIDSPHLDPVWLDNSILQTIEPRYFITIDSEMDLLVKGDFYIPHMDDAIYRAEISAPDREPMRDKYSAAEEVAVTMWTAIARRDCFKYFVQGMKLPVNRDIRPAPANVLPAPAMKGLRNFLINSILSADVLRGYLKRSHNDFMMV